MALNTFGVTPDRIRRHYFPHIDAFSANSSPTLVTVTERIDSAAARLAGQLLLKNIDPDSGITAGSYAYTWCAETVCIIAAIRLTETMTGQAPAVVESWRKDLEERFELLSKNGETALGGGADAFGTSESAGPTDFISELSLDVGDTSLASDVTPHLRRSDQL